MFKPKKKTYATVEYVDVPGVTKGEGGALVVNQPRYLDRAEIIREKGTDRHRFFKGQVDKYTWVDVGSSYLPSEILAAQMDTSRPAPPREHNADLPHALEKVVLKCLARDPDKRYPFMSVLVRDLESALYV